MKFQTLIIVTDLRHDTGRDGLDLIGGEHKEDGTRSDRMMMTKNIVKAGRDGTRRESEFAFYRRGGAVDFNVVDFHDGKGW